MRVYKQLINSNNRNQPGLVKASSGPLQNAAVSVRVVMAFVMPAIGVLLRSVRMIVGAGGAAGVLLGLVEVETVAVRQTALRLVAV